MSDTGKTKTVTVRMSVGEPFATESECPRCLFDSMWAVLIFVNDMPRFHTFCDRTVCRELGEASA